MFKDVAYIKIFFLIADSRQIFFHTKLSSFPTLLAQIVYPLFFLVKSFCLFAITIAKNATIHVPIAPSIEPVADQSIWEYHSFNEYNKKCKICFLHIILFRSF